jgi:hypothetical protein
MGFMLLEADVGVIAGYAVILPGHVFPTLVSPAVLLSPVPTTSKGTKAIWSRLL